MRARCTTLFPQKSPSVTNSFITSVYYLWTHRRDLDERSSPRSSLAHLYIILAEKFEEKASPKIYTPRVRLVSVVRARLPSEFAFRSRKGREKKNSDALLRLAPYFKIIGQHPLCTRMKFLVTLRLAKINEKGGASLDVPLSSRLAAVTTSRPYPSYSSPVLQFGGQVIRFSSASVHPRPNI